VSGLSIDDILRKHWLGDGPRGADPEPLTRDEVLFLCDQLPAEYAVEDLEDRGDGHWWHVPTWYDRRDGSWMRDEGGHVYE
jgi:hypothetical protein